MTTNEFIDKITTTPPTNIIAAIRAEASQIGSILDTVSWVDISTIPNYNMDAVVQLSAALVKEDVSPEITFQMLGAAAVRDFEELLVCGDTDSKDTFISTFDGVVKSAAHRHTSDGLGTTLQSVGPALWSSSYDILGSKFVTWLESAGGTTLALDPKNIRVAIAVDGIGVVENDDVLSIKLQLRVGVEIDGSDMHYTTIGM